MERRGRGASAEFTGEVRRTADGRYVIDVPEGAFGRGDLRPGAAVRCALFTDERSHPDAAARRRAARPEEWVDQPVAEGEVIEVEIEAVGEEGDGIAFVDGLSVFVPGTDIGDTPVVEIESVQETFAHAVVRG